MTTIKNETKNTTTTALLEFFEGKGTDFSKATTIRDTVASNLAEFKALAPAALLDSLLLDAVYRMPSKDFSKLKVGSDEYATATRALIEECWQQGFKDNKSRNTATRAAKSSSKSGAVRLPFSQSDILARCAELAPSGKSTKAVRVRETLTKLAGFSSEAFTLYYTKSLENSGSLIAKAVTELKQEQLEAIRAKEAELLGDMDIL